jgi:hypothetical protein
MITRGMFALYLALILSGGLLFIVFGLLHR